MQSGTNQLKPFLSISNSQRVVSHFAKQRLSTALKTLGQNPQGFDFQRQSWPFNPNKKRRNSGLLQELESFLDTHSFRPILFLLLLYISFAMTERHAIRLCIEVLKVKLSVKFPCKLAFQLRDENKRLQSNFKHQLTNGECNAKQSLSIDIQALYDYNKKLYEEHKICLIVKMISNSGSIPAGNTNFNIFAKQDFSKIEFQSNLDKCPDKAATVSIAYSYQLIKILEHQPLNGERTNTKKNNNILRHSLSGGLLSSFNPSQNSINIKSSQARGTQLPIKSPIHTDIFQSLQKSIIKERMTVEDFKKNRFVHETSLYENGEKAGLQKEVSKFRAEIKHSNNTQYKQHWQKLKEENNLIVTELQRAKEKTRGYQRRQRELNLQAKQAKQENERLKNKILVLQAGKSDTQVQFASKDRTIKQLQLQRKSIQAKLQEANILLVSLNKKIEYKQQSLQDQIKKISQKLASSQSQKQKLLVEQNSLLNKLQQSQKRSQLTVKEKEKFLIEQKGKYSKQIEALSYELTVLKEAIREKDKTLLQQNLHLNTLNQANQVLSQTVTSLQMQKESLATTLRKEVELKKENEIEIATLKAHQSQKAILRKKNSELNAQFSSLTDKLQRANSQINHLNDKIRQLQSFLVEKTKEKDALSHKNTELIKQFEALKRQDEKNKRQADTLSVQNTSYYQRYLEIKNQNERQQRQLALIQEKMNQQILAFEKGKQIIQNQNEELKQTTQRFRSDLQGIKSKNREANNSILQLNQNILMIKESLKRQQEKNRQIQIQNKQLSKKIRHNEEKQRVLNLQLKEKDEKLFEFSRKLQAIESQCYVLKERSKQLQNSNSQLRSNNELLLRQKEKQLSINGDLLVKLNIELQSKNQELSLLKANMSRKTVQNHQLKQSLQHSLDQLSNKERKLRQKQEEISFISQNLEIRAKEQTQAKIRLEEKTKSEEKILQDWNLYKNATFQALQTLLTQLTKENLSNPSLLSFPDGRLSDLQSQMVKKFTNLLRKYESNIKQVKVEMDLLSEQLKRSKQQIQNLQSQAEIRLRQNTESSFKNAKSLKNEIKDLQAKVIQLQQQLLKARYQSQNLTKQSLSKAELIEQYKEEINKMLQQIQQRNLLLRDLQEQVLVLKSIQIKKKSSISAQLQQINQKNSLSALGYKQLLDEAEKKGRQYQRLLKQKAEIIRTHEASIIQITYNLQKTQQKLEEVLKRIENQEKDKGQLQKRALFLQKQVKLLNNSLSQSKSLYQSENIKCKQLQSQHSELYKNITALELQIQRQRSEIQVIKSEKQDSQFKSKEKEEKLKVLLQKQLFEGSKYKQNLIKMTSLHQLSQFKLQQQEKQLINLKEQLKIAKEELSKRKQDYIKISEEANLLKNEQINHLQTIENLKIEADVLQSQIQRSKQAKLALEEELLLLQNQIEVYADINNKVQTQNQQIESLKIELMKQKGLQATQTVANFSESRITRTNNTEERRKIRELQLLLERKHHELASEKKKLLSDWQTERNELIEENHRLKERVTHMSQEFEFQRQQFVVEIKSLQEDCLKLQEEIKAQTD